MGMKNRKKSSNSHDPLAGTVTKDVVQDEVGPESGAMSMDSGAATAVADKPEPDVVVGTAMETAMAAPDAMTLKAADWTLRQPPAVVGSRDPKYQVIFRQSVLDEIHEHGKAFPEVEVCGVLVGNIYQDGLAPYAYVEGAIAGNDAVTKQTQVTITSQTWTRIHETLERDFPDKRIVGWYHTHPGFGIFLSGMDLFIQENFFNAVWQVAFVYDPLGGDEGVFIWRGKPEREPHLIENDTGATLARSGFASATTVAELTDRLHSLENKLTWLMTGLVMLLVVALLWPMAFLTYFPETVRELLNSSEEPSNQMDKSALPAPSTSGGPAPQRQPINTPGKTAAPSKSEPRGSGPVKNSDRSEGPAAPTDEAVTASDKIPASDKTSSEAPAASTRDGGAKVLTVSPDQWAPASRSENRH